MANYASKVIEIAAAEVGYLEKKSNSQLDDTDKSFFTDNTHKNIRCQAPNCLIPKDAHHNNSLETISLTLKLIFPDNLSYA